MKIIQQFTIILAKTIQIEQIWELHMDELQGSFTGRMYSDYYQRFGKQTIYTINDKKHNILIESGIEAYQRRSNNSRRT